jgi:GntR family transcriptional regulator, transcriptional repressor for pyruvate dehydrogenase complex
MSGNRGSHLRSKPEGDLTVQLISKFKQLILEGVLGPGSRLPPERSLAKQLGVSRPILRQALKVLSIMEILSQRVGDGTYLNESAAVVLQEPVEFLILLSKISHYELFEARIIVEPELAARAADRATGQDVTALRRAISAMEKCSEDNQKIIECDLAFHHAIFRATGNRVCEAMFGVLHKALLNSMASTSMLVKVDHTLSFHKAIFSAIDRRQPEEARRSMLEHLIDARQVLLAPRSVQSEYGGLKTTRIAKLVRNKSSRRVTEV